MSDIETRLTQIEARANAASEGPWTWATHETVDGDAWAVFDASDHALASNRDGWGPDAEFIAHSCEDVLWLVGEVRRLREQVEAALESVESSGMRTHYDTMLRRERKFGRDESSCVCEVCKFMPTVRTVTEALGAEL